MDAGAIGGVIGIGIMACFIVSYICYDKRNSIQKRWRRLVVRDLQHQSLLPVVIYSKSKQFKMREILVRK